MPQILAVPGVDAAFMGPFDLSFSLGLWERFGYPEGFATEEFTAACARVVECCRGAGVAAGNFSTGAGAAERMLSQGFTLLGMGTDLGLLGAGLQESEAELDKLRARDKV